MLPERERERERREEELEEEEEEEARLRSSAQQHGLELLDHFGITFLKRSFLFFFFWGEGEEAGAYAFRWEEKRPSVSQSVSQSVLMNLTKLGKACGDGGRLEEERSRLC
jgi:hypothetical protein